MKNEIDGFSLSDFFWIQYKDNRMLLHNDAQNFIY